MKSGLVTAEINPEQSRGSQRDSGFAQVTLYDTKMQSELGQGFCFVFLSHSHLRNFEFVFVLEMLLKMSK